MNSRKLAKALLAIAFIFVLGYAALEIYLYAQYKSAWLPIHGGISYNGRCVKGCRNLSISFTIAPDGKIFCARGVWIGVGVKRWGNSDSSENSIFARNGFFETPPRRILVAFNGSVWEFENALGLRGMFSSTYRLTVLDESLAKQLIKACPNAFSQECTEEYCL